MLQLDWCVLVVNHERGQLAFEQGGFWIGVCE